MKPNLEFAQLASDQQIERCRQALKENGFEAELANTGVEAKEKVLSIIPEGAEVFTMSSQTLEQISLAEAINNSGKYQSVRNKLYKMDRTTQGREMAKLGAAPDWVVASVHAVTEDGHLLIASNTGSQLSAEAYAGGKVIFVVGTQKIVKDTQEGLRRIYEYCLPLEDERARKVYGMGSNVSKILIINKEVIPQRITVILVKEKLGF
jgi:hypothetical protein